MTTGQLTFLHPEWLWLLPLLLVPFVLSAAPSLTGKGGKQRVSARSDELTPMATTADLRVVHPLLPHLSVVAETNRNGNGRMLLYSLVITCLLLALAEPVRIGQRLPEPPQERDIVFIVDASVAMTLRDYLLNGQRVDRMTLLKGLLGGVIDRLAGERMGIIVFGEHAYTLVPLSRDEHLLHAMLTRLNPTVAGRFNAVGEAIALAVSQSARQSTDRKRKRVLVLLSAASAPTGRIDPFAAASLAREAGLPLYTIAIGAGSSEAAEQRTGGLIYRPADLATLRALAEQTGALSFQAGNSDALTEAIADIQRRESNPHETAARHRYQPLYLWPLLLALTLLSLGQLIPLWRSRSA